jgi:hypothetical protein
VNGDVVARVSDGVERRGEADDDGAHLRMDVAKDVGDAGAREGYGLGGTGFVEAEVESLAVVEGEDVVKEGVGVGKLHDAADGNNLQMRHEGAVLLQQRVMALRCEGENGSVAEGFKPDYGDDLAMCGWRGLDAKMQFSRRGVSGAILRAENCGEQEKRSSEPAA